MTLSQCLAAARKIDEEHLKPWCTAIERTDKGTELHHLRWMVEEMHNKMSIGKAMRWLGYIQGNLVKLATVTFEEIENLNKDVVNG